MKNIILFLVIIASLTVFAQEKVVEVDPSQIRMSGYVHQSLPEEMLKRIKSTTDTFEIVDGISFEKAVDLYKRDLNPDSNLVIWEEMARVYKIFCKSRCEANVERKEVYRALLLRSMYSSEEAILRLQPKSLSAAEAKSIIYEYKLAAQPIEVIEK